MVRRYWKLRPRLPVIQDVKPVLDKETAPYHYGVQGPGIVVDPAEQENPAELLSQAVYC